MFEVQFFVDSRDGQQVGAHAACIDVLTEEAVDWEMYLFQKMGLYHPDKIVIQRVEDREGTMQRRYHSFEHWKKENQLIKNPCSLIENGFYVIDRQGNYLLASSAGKMQFGDANLVGAHLIRLPEANRLEKDWRFMARNHPGLKEMIESGKVKLVLDPDLHLLDYDDEFGGYFKVPYPYSHPWEEPGLPEVRIEHEGPFEVTID
jgi:hypothetical protein